MKMRMSDKTLVSAFVYIIVSAMVLFIFMVRPGVDGHAEAGFPDVVYGRAKRPFVYRALVPVSVRAISQATPQALKDRINEDFARKRTVRMLGWKKDYIYDYLVAVFLMMLFLAGYAFCLRSLAKHYYDYQGAVLELIPAGGLMILPLFFRYYSYIYDPANLFLFTLAILLIAKRRDFWFFVIFVLAALNKETSIFLAGLFFLDRWRRQDWRGACLGTASLFFIWIAIKAALAWIYRNNPGSFIEMHLVDHNLRVPFDHPISLAYFLAIGAIFAAAMRSEWRKKPAFLREGLILTLLPLLLLHFFFGYIDELRGYYEALPFVFLLSLPSVVKILGRR